MPRHFPCGPSTLYRRMHCPGSMSLEGQGPEQPSVFSEAGTNKHAVLAAWIRHGLKEGFDGSPPPEYQSHLDLCDEDEWEAYSNCLNFLQWLKPLEAEGTYGCCLVESKVELAFIHPLIGEGTLDFGFIADRHTYPKGIVVDWKFGWRRAIPAKDNPQLKAYASGFMRDSALTKVHAFVVQAAWNRFSEATWTGDDLKRFENEARAAVERCTESPKCDPGDWCHNCRAVERCPAALENWLALPTALDPDKLPAAVVGKILDRCELAQSFIGHVKETALKRLLAGGGPIPGWHIRRTKKHRQWKPEAEATLRGAASAYKGERSDIWTKPELLSPAMIEKKWGKSAKVRAVIDPLTERLDGEPGLEKDSERKEIGNASDK